MVPVPHRVIERIQETEDTWTLELAPRDGSNGKGRFAPGQFNMLYAFGIGEVPISISGPLEGGAGLVHTIRDVGPVSRAICAAEPGDTLGVRGPFGSCWPSQEAEGRDLVIVAGGLGLAPLRSALLAAIAAPQRYRAVFLLYGGREPAQLLYREQIGHWLTKGLEASLIVDSAAGGWLGEVGVVTKLIERAPFDPEQAVAMVCGPETMMRFSARALRARGVGADRIHISMERNMKCAITHCGRCQFGPTFVCRDGPVFRFSEIEQFFAIREI
jgi:NAD(P)H-flavin reductase